MQEYIKENQNVLLLTITRLCIGNNEEENASTI